MKASFNRARRAVDGGLKSVLNALDLLDCFQRDEQLGVTDLADRLEISKSSAHRLLTSLCDRGFAARDPETGRYQLGLRLHELGQLTISRLPIRPRARPILEDLRQRTGFTVHLAVPDAANVIYIERMHGPGRYPAMARISARMPVHVSSSGKAIAAFDPLVANARREAGFPAWTPKSIRDLAGFNAALEQTKRRGYAVNAQEAALGITSVAAPVRNRTGRAVAAISLVATSAELEDRIESNARLVIVAARRLVGDLDI
ncbi:IclR family transcriptional regulator [[Mycobacterium] crassicus]|uniref:IclR family transcriptional regulator n=1 Tax=[Mycobacterium] crassicus TaxID=2872309 RepID=A0ABU5XIR0_9MYCO|nr:IclR family transcriptional regulator [Mycolicibacter sp. MYC098]MEB3022129.1 IclR family transcriptional regulator [Mycolicibacter sp. MYC098]